MRVTLSASGLILLQCASECALQDALTSEIAVRIPAPQQASILGDYGLLWLAPAEWLLELPASQTDSLQTALTHRLATSLAAVTDMSDAFACCEVSGARAGEALLSGCSLDLRAHKFPPGQVARTALADIPAILWNPGTPDRFRCLVDRSLEGHLLDWLMDVSRVKRTSSAP